MRVEAFDVVVVGTGAAGYNAASRIQQEGTKTVCIVTEGVNRGTSRNTGSDKQTYYKLGLGGDSPDSVAQMAQDLFSCGSVDGDTALCEAALSARCFMHLVELGVPFPVNRYGEYVGYKTDHDPFARATSAGPLMSKFMTEALERMAQEQHIPVFDATYAVEILRDRGFRQYEISNFARKGLYSRHNYKYWTGGEYLGFGPSASSDFAGKRFTLISDLQGYINGIRTGGDIMDDIQEIPLRERAGEYIMLRLRTNAGMSAQEYENTFMLPFAPLEEILRKHEAYGRAVQNGDGRWALTPKGYLVSNDIISDLLIAQDETGSMKRG